MENDEEAACLKLDRRVAKLGLVETLVKSQNCLDIWIRETWEGMIC